MKIISCSRNETLTIAKLLAKNISPGDIVGLFGELGSGKTVFVKGLASGLGIQPDQIISPTFILIRQYRGRLDLFHFDLYRLDTPDDILKLGYEEYFYGEGASVIEWAQRLGSLLPKEMLKIKIKILGKNKRCLEFSPGNKHYERLIKKTYENTCY